jgi:hypothetical protein
MSEGITLTPRLLWVWASLLAALVGSLGTWATLGIISVSGGDKDGAIVVVLAVVAAVLVALHRWPIGVAVLALLMLTIGVFDWQDITSKSALGIHFGVGWGLVLVCIASASLLGWAVSEKRTRTRPT